MQNFVVIGIFLGIIPAIICSVVVLKIAGYFDRFFETVVGDAMEIKEE